MRPLPSHQQVELTTAERLVLLPICSKRLSNLKHYEQQMLRFTEGEELQGTQQLRMELDRLVYILGEELPHPIAISTPLFVSLLAEMIESLHLESGQVPVGLLMLYVRLSKDFVLFSTGQVLDVHFDQFRSEEKRQAWIQLAAGRKYVSTAGMDPLEVFRALFNAARPQGRGYHAEESVCDIDTVEARRLMADPANENEFDYVQGRRMKISRKDLESGYLDVTDYDRGNGEGAASRALAGLVRR